MGCAPSQVGSQQVTGEALICFVNRTPREAESVQKNEVKLLFLGSAGTGKSTLMKQIRIIHGSAYEEKERLLSRQTIHNNTIDGMAGLIQGLWKLGIELGDPGLEDDINAFMSMTPPEVSLNPALGKLAQKIWQDAGVQEAYRRCHEFQLSDAAVYFLRHLPRLSSHGYVPSEQDILHCRAQTLSIIDQSVLIRGVSFRLIDVGGQRSERRKWIHCFQDVTAVLFCVALSSYDMFDAEKNDLNQMTESLNIFDALWNSHWLANSTFFVILNKSDVFREKLRVSKMVDFFPAYKGDNDYDSASVFVQKMFLDVAVRTDKNIHVFFTCATNTENIQLVFHVVAEMILQENMKNAGLF
ncbi:guanine nucleotide-binding protein G(i) subunit alpha-like [Pollicipes pollicipes]|uniref:guanine nucleotide-binding protein G(i) subunit alpha-like n=1 Tax=Pollicipes pollicipes TaxID=41117 RepID=UPI00188505B0|nr:guanine nucleotide-binding protein G(i) subunit alpha-like [Pollicipes pollicipes]